MPGIRRPVPSIFSSSVMIKPALTVAVKAARAAGNVILRRMARLDAIPVTEKDRFDFASEVDRQAEAEIIKELGRAYPRHAILAEESGARGKGDIVWIIDPLDGTHNYLRGFPHFCISIAQMVRGQAEVGVIFDPIRNELFTASAGGGAFINDRRMRVADRKTLATSGPIAALWGQGWFLLSNPVYGPSIRGGFADIFPSDKQWEPK